MAKRQMMKWVLLLAACMGCAACGKEPEHVEVMASDQGTVTQESGAGVRAWSGKRLRE